MSGYQRQSVSLCLSCLLLSLQSFLSLANLLSSSHSVWELLGRQLLANKSEYALREMPSCIPVSVLLTVQTRLGAVLLSAI